MTYAYTEGGLNFVENVLTDASYTETLNTIALGNGDSSPNSNDTSLENELYSETAAATGISFEAGTGTGEIRITAEFTGGTEVPADANISEIGLKGSDNSFVYREVRDAAINVASGETKIIEIRIFVEDLIVGTEQVITDPGKNTIADIILGISTDRIDTIAVGVGTGTVSPSDTTLSNELYRADNSSSIVILSPTSNVGEVRAEITISAGADADDEVAANSQISEFGLFSNGTLILHEKRTPITLEANDTKTFKIPFNITQ